MIFFLLYFGTIRHYLISCQVIFSRRELLLFANSGVVMVVISSFALCCGDTKFSVAIRLDVKLSGSDE